MAMYYVYYFIRNDPNRIMLAKRAVTLASARTAQFVTLRDIDNGKGVRCKVHLWDGHEACYPDGRYSMCPVLESTDRVSREKVPEGTKITARLPGRRG